MMRQKIGTAMRLLLLGPQGAGKGTQAQRLSLLTGAQHISTGDLIRAEIAAGTPLGHAIKDYNDRGALVPDDIIVAMTMPYLAAGEGWILDGFPRTRGQAAVLDAALAGSGIMLDRVIALEADDDAVIERLSGRRQSRATGRIYHLTYNPPPADDPGPFVQRDDDTCERIRRRLEIYHRDTEPLKGYYARRGLLVEVDATQAFDTVTAAILRSLQGVPSPSKAGGLGVKVPSVKRDSGPRRVGVPGA